MNFLIRVKSMHDIAKQKYASRKETIDGILLAFFMALSTYVLLKLASYFSEKWIGLISVLIFLLGVRMPMLSLTVLVLAFSVSLIYQNPLLGIVTFLAFSYLASYYDRAEKMKMSLYFALVPLMFLGMEFFPIIAISLLYGYKNGLKAVFLTLLTGLFFTAVLSYPNFGHFNPGFSSPLVPNLKPPQDTVTISNLIKFESFEISRVSLLVDSILNSSSLVAFILFYTLIGIIPSYVKDVFSRFGDIYTFLAMFLSCHLTILAIAHLYYPLSGLEWNLVNFVEISISSIFAWLVYTLVRPPQIMERNEQEEKVEMQPQTKTNIEAREMESGRLEALRREIEGGGKH